MIRAVFEGVAFNSRWILKYVEQFNGRNAEAVNMVGGGAKSNIWCQIHADVLDRPIRQMKDPIEVNVRGAALLASAALGYSAMTRSARMCPWQTPTTQTRNRKMYDELFAEFVAIYENNRKIYARLNCRDKISVIARSGVADEAFYDWRLLRPRRLRLVLAMTEHWRSFMSLKNTLSIWGRQIRAFSSRWRKA